MNLLGAFLLGYFTTRLLERLPLSNYRRPLVGTGLCGGLTTFSTMNLLCAYLAAAVLLGLLTNTLLGWWWLGLGIAALAVREGIHTWHGQDCC